MKLLTKLRAEGKGRDLDELLEQIPYARFIGLQIEARGAEIVTKLPFAEQLVGNPKLPAVHGGVVGSMLEMTSVLQLLYDTSCARLPKTIDVSFDFLRFARCTTLHARAIVTRHGRRVANVRSELWQEDRAKPIALSHGHFLLTPLAGDEGR